MAEGVPPMDEKAKRTRDLLASFYSPDASAALGGGGGAGVSPRRIASPDSINSPFFDPEVYMSILVRDLSRLLQLISTSLAGRPFWILECSATSWCVLDLLSNSSGFFRPHFLDVDSIWWLRWAICSSLLCGF